MIRLKQLLTENEIVWKTPNLDGAQESIESLSDELFIDKQNIINSFPNGKIVYIPKSKMESISNVKLGNIESYLDVVDFIQSKQKSNPEYVRDWISIRDALKNGQPIQAPIIMKHKKEYYVLDGQIRLMVSRILGIPPRVYLFYYQG
jgi:hypothetical protein